jgi:hypothetical protein
VNFAKLVAGQRRLIGIVIVAARRPARSAMTIVGDRFVAPAIWVLVRKVGELHRRPAIIIALADDVVEPFSD